MKDYGTQDLRNVALVSQHGTGKTSLAEAILHLGKVTNRLGRVDDGTSLLDHSEDEIERKITTSAKLAHVEWKTSKINLIDTPGYADFVGEVVAGLRVADSVLFLLKADAGVEPSTDNVWDRVRASGLPTMLVVSQMDRENANFGRVVASTAELMERVVPVALPIGSGAQFKGLVDILTMKAYELKPDGSRSEIPIPSGMQAEVDAARSAMIEAAAEGSDELLEKYLSEGELTPEEITAGLRSGIFSAKVVPAVPVAALQLAGVGFLLDTIVAELPSPVDRGPVVAKRGDQEIKVKPSASEKTSLLVWKTTSEGQAGELAYVRVASGKAVPGLDLQNPSHNTTARLGHLAFVQGKDRKEAPALVAGDLGAAIKLHVKIGDTLCEREIHATLPGIAFPNPTLTEAIIPKTKGEEDKMAAGLTRIVEEDPTYRLVHDAELHQTRISGMGDLHLDLMMKRLKRRFHVAVELIKPRIPYRETIRGKTTIHGRHKKQTGGRGQFGDVHLRIEALPRGTGFEFADEIVGGVVPNKFIPAVEKGVRETMVDGVIAGCPVVDVRVALYDGSYHAVDSSEMAFKLAATKAFKEGFELAGPMLLEPILDVEIVVPEDYMGDVMGDISSKRGRILGMDSVGKRKVLKAQVPQAEMYRFATTLRSLTQGRAWHSEKFSHYEEVTPDVQEKVVAEAAKLRVGESEKEKVG